MCVVRDPLGRALSEFKQRSFAGGIGANNVTKAAAQAWLVERVILLGRRRRKNFCYGDCHLLQQTEYISSADGTELTCQYVLRFEGGGEVFRRRARGRGRRVRDRGDEGDGDDGDGREEEPKHFGEDVGKEGDRGREEEISLSEGFDRLMMSFGLDARLPTDRDLYSHHSAGYKPWRPQGALDTLLLSIDPEIARIVRCMYRDDLCLLGYGTNGKWGSSKSGDDVNCER